jgi:hypothetical protein
MPVQITDVRRPTMLVEQAFAATMARDVAMGFGRRAIRIRDALHTLARDLETTGFTVAIITAFHAKSAFRVATLTL